MGSWRRTCCYCNGLIWRHGAKKVDKCENDGTVFWAHPKCYSEFKENSEE